MKKLFLIFILLTLGLTLMSCDDNDLATGDEKVLVPNSSLIDDLVGEVKEVFED